MITFGPVPSRRLGQSLGINNIPPKICTYSCIYCQLGRTRKMQVDRQKFYDPKDIFRQVQEKIKKAAREGDRIDYLTFVPDGEPTLDIQLGKEIELLRNLGIKIAVITNASLLWRKDVRQHLYAADWISFKVDAVEEDLWRTIDRPHRSLSLQDILNGIRAFAASFKGELTTETMLVDGVNDSENHLRKIARFLEEIQPSTAYLAIPTRPPAEKNVHSPNEGTLIAAYRIFSEKIKKVELLIGYEGTDFGATDDPETDLLAITAVHPMREDAVARLLSRTENDWSLVDRLLTEKKLTKIRYLGQTFYLRKLSSKN